MLLNNFIYLQTPNQGQFFLSQAASPKAFGIYSLHDDIMIVLTIICCFVLWLLLTILIRFPASNNWKNDFRNSFSFSFYHHAATLLETVWTVTPALVILAIASPSFSLLYSLEELFSPNLTLKCIGHQWYWEYEMQYLIDSDTDNPESVGIKFDSYMLDVADVQERKTFRLLDVDYCLYLPINSKIRLLVTSADVLHCWTIPAFGVKLDACPGRLNATTLLIDRLGNFYGQCSEICGVNHGFMPIHVVACPVEVFEDTLLRKSFEE